MKNIMVVAVHPDDETLGCGGTLLKHKAAGDQIHWCIATTMPRDDRFTEQEINNREEEINKVAAAYGFKSVIQLGLPTMRLDTLPMTELINQLATAIVKIQPDTLYLPFFADVHSDHRKIFEASFSCAKKFRSPFVNRILMMETLSETEFAPAHPAVSFVPNVFVDISNFFEQKIKIMSFYHGELGQHPFPRSETSIRSLAMLRGASAGCQAAESFMLLKETR